MSEITGIGASVTVTTAQQVSLKKACRRVVVINNGSGQVYALANCTETEFAAAIAAGTAIIVPVSAAIGNPFTFDGPQDERAFSHIWLQSVSGSNAVIIQAI